MKPYKIISNNVFRVKGKKYYNGDIIELSVKDYKKFINELEEIKDKK